MTIHVLGTLLIRIYDFSKLYVDTSNRLRHARYFITLVSTKKRKSIQNKLQTQKHCNHFVNPQHRFHVSRRFSTELEQHIDETNKKLASFRGTGRIGEAVAFFTKVQSLKQVNSFSYDIVFGLFSEIKDLKEEHMEYVIDIYRDKRDRKVPSSKFTYEKILKICFKYGRYQLGAAFLEEMRKEKVPRDQMFYNLILKEVAKLQDLTAIQYIRNFMKKDEISMNVKTYSSILQAYYHLRDERSFNKTLQEMLAQGISPDIYIFVQIISFYGNILKSREMVNWFEKLKETIEPNVEVYNALIDGLLHCSDRITPSKYLEDMKKAGIEPNIRTYNTLINGFSRDKEKMLSIIDEMNKRQMSFDKHTYMLVVTFLADHDQFGKAEQFIDKMESQQIFSTDPYNSLLFRLGKVGKYQVSVSFAFSLLGYGTNSSKNEIQGNCTQ